jgi:hypothetical protein
VTDTPLRLRGHHFICLQFFRGEGESPEYVANLESVVERLATEPAEAVAIADDICAACPDLGTDGRCGSARAGGEDEIARIDALAFELLEMAPGDRITLAEARNQLGDYAIGVGRWRAQACDGCAWEVVCERGWGRLLGDAERAARADPAR